MADWVVWFVLAGVLVMAEIFTGTFYLLMIGLGLFAGGVVATFGFGHSTQLVTAAVVGIASTYMLRRSKWGKRPTADAARDPNINLDIGQTLTVEYWEPSAATARVSYRGAQWDVQLAEGATAAPGIFTIREIRGSRLIVSNQN